MKHSINDDLPSAESYITTLQDIAAVEITGNDAREFLSNQLSSDVQALHLGELQHSSWCDPKGRVLFYLQLAKSEDSIYCFVTTELVEQFCKRLSMFVLRAAVKIEHLENHTVLGINSVGQTLQQLNDTFYFPHTPSSSSSRCLSLIKDEHLQNTIKKLDLPESKGRWRYDNIVLGHPYVCAEASGAFLPQNLNLDALNGISFSKGCYPGQEIIARLKYRGKVKQRLAVLLADSEWASDQPILPMTAIFAVDNQEKKIGTTLASQRIGRHLAVSGIIAADLLQTENEVLIDGCSEIFPVSPPPYDIEY